jgi:2-hydroxychromene-2-carboxylate isomerase
MNQTVSFLFDYASPWAYLADELLEQELAGIPIDFQPVYLRGFESFSKGVPFTPAKLAYIGRDFARCTEHRGVAVCQPSAFPINGLHALRGALAAQQMGQFGEFHRAAFRAAWAEDRNISSAEVVLDLAAELGFDRADFSARVASAEVKGELRRLTENAIERGAFGVPSFLVGEELFWGHDRMDYVRRAACGEAAR